MLVGKLRTARTTRLHRNVVSKLHDTPIRFVEHNNAIEEVQAPSA
jgi:hypothetical protein